MKPLSVLIVDDDPDLAEGLEILLQLEDMSVACAASGEEGVEMFQRGSFDVVFIDVRLPGMRGLECLRKIRAIEPEAHVMMMTAYASRGSRQAALEAGASDLFKKPLDIDAVMAALNAVRRDVPIEEE